MGDVEKGDFIKVSYTGKRESDGKVFDSTDAETAKSAGIYNEHAGYGDTLVIVGSGHVIQGLDEALSGMNVGESKSISVPPEKAFGQRNPNFVRVMPVTDFKKQNMEPYPGLVINVDGKAALVKSVSSGRVMVDFNHLLAGETLLYDLKVVSKVTGLEEKINALMEHNGVEGKAAVSGKSLELTFGPSVQKTAEFLVNKANFVGSAFHFIPELDGIKVVEEYARPKPGEAAPHVHEHE